MLRVISPILFTMRSAYMLRVISLILSTMRSAKENLIQRLPVNQENIACEMQDEPNDGEQSFSNN